MAPAGEETAISFGTIIASSHEKRYDASCPVNVRCAQRNVRALAIAREWQNNICTLVLKAVEECQYVSIMGEIGDE